MTQPSLADLQAELEQLRRDNLELMTENQRLRQGAPEHDLQPLFEQFPFGIVQIDGEQLLLNQTAERLIGFTQSEVPTLRAWFARLYPDCPDEVYALYLGDREKGYPEPRIQPFVHKNGEVRLIEFKGQPSIPELGCRELWWMRDVTEAERAARLLAQTARAARTGGWEIDASTRRLYWTEETFQLHETTPEEYTPTIESAISFYHEESVPVIREAVCRSLVQGEPFDLELQLRTAKGRRLWVRSIGMAEHVAGRTVKLYGSFQDITQRREADEALRRSEMQKRRLISASPDGYFELDLAGHVLFANARALEFWMTSHNAILSRHWIDLWPEATRAELAELLERARQGKDGRLQARSLQGRVANGEPAERPRWWDVQVTAILDGQDHPERLLISVRDITPIKLAELERQEFERNLLQTQKLESLGVLAGGIAHDFNNLLTSVIGNAGLIRHLTESESATLEYLEAIERASERAADLCRQMLAFAGKGRLVVGPTDLGHLISESAPLLGLSIAKKATLTLRLAPGLPPVLADATQMRQVLMNLVINASESLGESEGVIGIVTGMGLVPSAQGKDPTILVARAQPVSRSVEGEHVFLEVTDTGCGMEAGMLARIFEPFYTTKFTGRGLGLSAVLGIVHGHNGCLYVESKPGRGSTFRIYLPVARDVANLARTPVNSPSGLAWRGQGKVLVVDDEDSVRQVASLLVTSFGFETVLAVDGRDALHKFEQNPEIRLVLLDLTMPRLDGEKTLHLLHQKSPGLPVVLMSGYSERELNDRFAHRGLAGLLTKPFTRDQVGQMLRRVLRDSSGSRERDDPC